MCSSPDHDMRIQTMAMLYHRRQFVATVETPRLDPPESPAAYPNSFMD
jgi:hypothetical protein